MEGKNIAKYVATSAAILATALGSTGCYTTGRSYLGMHSTNNGTAISSRNSEGEVFHYRTSETKTNKKSSLYMRLKNITIALSDSSRKNRRGSEYNPRAAGKTAQTNRSINRPVRMHSTPSSRGSGFSRR